MEKKNGFKEFLCTKGGKAFIIIAVYAVVLFIMSALGYFLSSSDPGTFGGILSLIVMAIWTILGWKALSRIQPNVFLIMPVGGWIAYIVVKGILSVILGIFIAPYYIGKKAAVFVQDSCKQ